MKAQQFAALAAEVYGRFGWAAKVASENKVDRSTAWRWGAGELSIPPTAVQKLRQAAAEKLSAIGRTLAE
jgi:hypothetical protein